MKSTRFSESEAHELHRASIIVDGHCDTPFRLKINRLRIDAHDETAQADLETLRESGITASFFAAYVPPYYKGSAAAKFGSEMIDVIHETVSARSDALSLATTSDEIELAKLQEKIAVLIGVEGGHAIDDSIEKLHEFFGRGARYLTLTHVNTNNWADSSGDEPKHGGMTRFGKEIVIEMNRLGMLVDVSHVADTTFYHVLETSGVPVIASHSSCRALTKHPRNLTDEMLRDLAQNDGICMINFYSAFVSDNVAECLRAGPSMGGSGEEVDDRAEWAAFQAWFRGLGCPRARLEDVVDHIVHAASVAGVEHVGIGSDFDGVPDLPDGLEHAGKLPALTHRLLERGFHKHEVAMVLGGNFMRVFRKVEAAAK